MADVIQVDEVVNAEEGTLRIWWIRNAPSPAEYWIVADVAEAQKVIGELTRHDLKDPRVDTCVGGLEVYEDGGWHEWYDEHGVDIAGFMDEENE